MKEKWPTLTGDVGEHSFDGVKYEVGLEKGIPNTILEYRVLKTITEETEDQIGKAVWEREYLLLSTDCDARMMLIDQMRKGVVDTWWAFVMATKFSHDFSPALAVELGWDYKHREPCIKLRQASKTVKAAS